MYSVVFETTSGAMDTRYAWELTAADAVAYLRQYVADATRVYSVHLMTLIPEELWS